MGAEATNCRERPRSRPDSLAVEDGAGVRKPRLVGEDEAVAATHAPCIVNARVDPAFAHRQAPERERFGDHELSLF